MKDSHQDEMTRIYNIHAEKYFSQVMDFEFPDGVFEIFLETLSGNKILDIGCGFGREITKLRKKGYEAYGIEISENMISYADESIQKYITQGDITKLETYYREKSFDGIISCASIVHMDKVVGQEVLKKAFRLLNNNGVIFLSLKVATQEKTIFKNSLSIPGVGKKYVYHNEDDLENFLENIGFEIIKKHSHTPIEDTWNIYICKK
ncbi:class I SAM-dependent methyltransferase [Candidatus Gracilibacteria bacterium]|nr:class I SAM-dependent methyltransferase [Candidatus Gracilibacteria bacterium]